MMDSTKKIVTQVFTTPGSQLRIRGYRSSSGDVRDLTVQLIGRDGYLDLVRKALKWLEEQEKPLPGTDPAFWDTARMEQQTSWAGSLANGANDRESKSMPLAGEPNTGYFTREDRPNAIFLVHVKSCQEVPVPDLSSCRTPVTAAKKLMQAVSPIGAYIGMLILEPGKFESVEIVTPISEVNFSNYIERAMRTTAPHEPVLERLTFNPTHLDLLHSALGVTSEANELQESNANPDPEARGLNLKEELGDLFWFCALGLRACHGSFEPALREFEKTVVPHIGDLPTADRWYAAVSQKAAHYANHVKAVVFGGKTVFKFGGAELTIEQRLQKDLEELITMVLACCQVHRVKPEDIIAANIAKLKARYPQKFTEAAFANRDVEKEMAAVATV